MVTLVMMLIKMKMILIVKKTRKKKVFYFCFYTNQIEHIEDYGKSDYWDDRYLNDTDQFDWLVEYKDLEKEDLIYNIIYPTDLILILGCGNASILFIVNIIYNK